MILELVSYIGTAFGFLFLTLSIASGLYYISEIVEEHSEPTKRILTRAIYGIIILLVMLVVFDQFPIKLSLFAIVSHIIYLQNLKTFPIISLTGPTFIISCITVIINHYFWFQYFNNIEIPPQFRYDPNYIPRKRASFTEVATFFGLCVWFIPFALFVSLSAGDYLLPTTADNKKTDETRDTMDETRFKRKTVGLARVVINSVRRNIFQIAQMFGYQGNDPSFEGLGI
ncbi:hypothetical protein TBLA_0C06660 [Henningerozyma blattae CBS 6284]|uniref:Protein SVP26 n=1 Tax=Henningerozyma blattae (strain ATCC 34711 / CBS 6284 / DSM 70876 / NBRC 10599 / NRRL Y-10934 / UCD 77-7) TaxID=1071380 RepID=I2H257_HENB6|nr:hypothetical protein TBLA_0C06660 [Tetrapisispora blattae CBS 6284]CCH60459.1 hypothetical protein TBLA_0C06660 [Tetrapisispora blattae CBS 6284]